MRSIGFPWDTLRLYQKGKGTDNLMRHYSKKYHNKKYFSPHTECENNSSYLLGNPYSIHSHMAAYSW